MELLKFKIRGSGIRGYKHHKDKWDAKKNTGLEVKLNDHLCLSIYTDQNILTGTIAQELQEVLKTFQASKPSSKITVTVTSSKAVFKVKGKGQELPCDIFLIGENTPAVRNDIRAVQEVIKKLRKKDGMDLSIMKMRMKMAGNVRSGQTAAASDNFSNERPETDDGNNEANISEERLEQTAAAGDANSVDSSRNERPEENMAICDLDYADGDGYANKDENTCITKRKLDTSTTDEGAPKNMKTKIETPAKQTQPGLTDEKTYVFRYQYLLIEVGTEILKALFDNHVKNDLMGYLDANSAMYDKLKLLIRRKKLTKPQQKLLPPLECKPLSSNFDITLLSFLLGNICGYSLCEKPDPSNLSVEADVARLRICRNYLSHSGTVFISKNDFTSKWTELCGVLNRLNNECGIADFPSKIDAAKDIEIDKELKESYDNTLKLWDEIDQELNHRIGNLQETVDGIKKDVSGMKDDMSDLKDGQADMKNEQAKLTKKLSEMDKKLKKLTKQ